MGNKLYELDDVLELYVYNDTISPNINTSNGYMNEETPELIIAEEILDAISEFFEGAKKTIIVNAYERNTKARKLCIDKYGYNCCVCDFNFKEAYGDIGIDFIVVHHLKPLSEINMEYKVDPINDLRPICPNCHSILHRSGLSIEQLKEIIL